MDQYFLYNPPNEIRTQAEVMSQNRIQKFTRFTVSAADGTVVTPEILVLPVDSGSGFESCIDVYKSDSGS